MSLVLLGSKGRAGEDVGLHQQLTPISAGRGSQDLGTDRSCMVLAARDEHPGGITMEWLLLWQENKPVSA